VRRSGASARQPAKSENRIGLVNEIAVSIHHVVKSARFYPVAFIFDERRQRMVNRWYAALKARSATGSGVNSMLNRVCFKREE
jgi:hypothetical protein